MWGHAQVGTPKPLCPEEGTRAQANFAHHLGRPGERLGCPPWVWGARACFQTHAAGHTPAGADLSPPTGRRTPCGRRQRALTPRCPARRPTTQGSAPAATRISASSPGGTTAGGLWGTLGVAPGWHSSHCLLSWQAVPGQGVPRVLRGHGQAGALLSPLLPAKALTGYISQDHSPCTVPGTPPALAASSPTYRGRRCWGPSGRSCCPTFWV